MIKNKQNKTIVKLSIAVVLLLMFTITMTFAYFTANRSATSGTMTFGTLEVEINNYAASSAECHTPMVPGCTIALAGTITMTSNIESLIRIKPSVIVTPAQGSSLNAETASATLLGLLINSFEGLNNSNWLRPQVNNVATGDYLYYVSKVAANGSISLSGVTITIPENAVGNDWQDASLVIGLTVQAIQAEHVQYNDNGTMTDIDFVVAGANTKQMIANRMAGIVANTTDEDTTWSINFLEPEIVSLAAINSMQYFDFVDVTTNNSILASENDSQMNSLNNLVASKSNLMADTNMVNVAVKSGVTIPADTELEIPKYVKVENNSFVATDSSEYGGNGVYKVVGVSANGFDASNVATCVNIKSITIPNSITTINTFAFKGCTGLTDVIVPDSVTSIGIGAFSGCGSMTSIQLPIVCNIVDNGTQVYYYPFGYIFGSVSFAGASSTMQGVYYTFENGYGTSFSSYYIPNSLTTVTITKDVEWGVATFYGCTKITNFVLPNGLTSIGQYSFHGCTGLTSISIPNTVTKILKDAFSNCTNLESVTIPDSVTTIDTNAFNKCTKLETVYLGNNVKLINDAVFDQCNNLTYNYYDQDANVKYLGSVNNPYYAAFKIVDNTASFVNLHGDTKVLCGNVFKDCANLTGISLPTGLKGISYSAFKNCSGLTSITIPENVSGLGTYVFDGCTSLNSIVVDSNNTTFRSRGTVNLVNNTQCNAIISIADSKLITGCKSTVIPDDVTNIANYAFYGCTGLTSIAIPDSVTTMGNQVFYGCTGLTSVSIGRGLASMGYQIFYNCVSLSNITVDSNNTVYNSANNCNAIILTETNTLLYGCANTAIPNSVTSIASNAFYNNTSLTSIVIPNTVTSIGTYAFYGCTGLESVTIEGGVTSIGNYAFYNCSSLTSIVITSSVTSIGSYAFQGCTGLINVYYTGTSEDWSSITINSNNTPLTNATITYGYVIA